MLRDATLDLLKYSPFSELGEALQQRVPIILDRWLALVKIEMPTADTLTLEQLRDELPDVLFELGKTLESSDGGHFDQMKATAEEHGQLRYHQSYNLNELLIEYGILRPLVIDEAITHLGRRLEAEESAALNMGLDTIVRRSVLRFTSFQQSQASVMAEAQSKYLAFLSHDLRGGLNGVLLIVEVLKQELAGETKFDESVGDLDRMRRAILDTVGTMDRFLHAERFRQGKVQPNNAPVDLQPLLGVLCSQMMHQAKTKGLDLQCVVPAGTIVDTDKDLILLIVQNLLSNAIKYQSKGKVALIADRRSTGAVVISVIDKGPGISAEMQAKLFEPFTRGETHGQPGVGLGLSMAKQAADVIGAKLSVESKLGSGSVFKVELE